MINSDSDADFAFAFNDSNFSDRVLQIEIIDDPVEARPDAEGCTTISDWASHHKRRREDIKNDNELTLVPEEHIMNENHPDLDDFVPCEIREVKKEQEAVAMKSPSELTLVPEEHIMNENPRSSGNA